MEDSTAMKIAIFGGSGSTGKQLVELALSRGVQIVALVRTPDKLALASPNLTLVRGDATDAHAVETAIRGVDAVISVLGPTINAPEKKITAATSNIVAAMQKENVRRLVVSVGAGVADPDDAPDLMANLMNTLVKTAARNVYQDMLQVSQVVRASDLDWTIVRVPRLVNGPPKGNVRVTWVGKGFKPTLTRADMAEFMLEQVTDRTYLRQAPAICNG